MRVRLDKYLADSGIGTRSEVKKELKAGCVTVNGTTIKNGDVKIDTEVDQICYGGKPIVRQDFVYYLFHKPAGCVSATEDTLHKTVLDYIDDQTHKDLFPVGRLDIDTEGLLIITNDGMFAHNLLSPKKHVDKTYYVELDTVIPNDAVEQMKQGLDIGEEKITLPANLTILSERTANLTIQEGKFHQVKRMFEVIGCQVTYLKRIQMGSLKLPEDLKPGDYRELTKSEMNALSH